MLGFGRCLVCKEKMPVGTILQAQRKGWFKLTFRKDVEGFDGAPPAKFTGMICPDCVPVVLDCYYDRKES